MTADDSVKQMQHMLSTVCEECKPFQFEDRRPPGRPNLPPAADYPSGKSPYVGSDKARGLEPINEFCGSFSDSRGSNTHSHAPPPLQHSDKGAKLAQGFDTPRAVL